MSAGTVMVLHEPSKAGLLYVVTCFVTDPTTGQPLCDPPWISEHRWKPEAEAEAKLHREEHRVEFARAGLVACPACGHPPDGVSR